MFKKTLIIFCLLLLQIPQIGLGFDRESGLLNQLASMLKQPESEVDVVIAMLTIDKIIDPSVDVNKTLRKIDALLAEVVKQSKDPLGDIQGLNKVLYEPGPWNDYRTYAYNLDDPFGKDLYDFLLSHYLDTKLGNCVSMPMLYYILGKKLGYEFYMSNAPRHLFAQAKVGERFVGIEATRNAKSWWLEDYISQWDINEKAKANKLYYERLSKKEIVSELLNQAVVYFKNTKQYGKAIIAADLALQYYPKNCCAMLNKAGVYALLIQNKIYLSGILGPQIKTEEEYYKALDSRYTELHHAADNLGDEKPSEKDNAEILERIRKIKNKEENV